MGNVHYKNPEVPNSYYSLYYNNYLINSYRYLIRTKYIHFLVSLIEVLLNIIHELDIFLKGFTPENSYQKKFMNILLFLPRKVQNLPMVIKALMVLLYIIIFDAIYYLIGKRKTKKKNVYFTIFINVIELFYFRISMLFLLNTFFCLSYIYIVILLLIVLPHLYITIYHFLYNHLYAFVPFFINYPYDEFSVSYDLFLLTAKILFSIMANSNNIIIIKSAYIIVFIFQILCCIYFLYNLFNRNYLMMNNLFLNKIRVALFFNQTCVLIIAELIGKKGIINISFLLIFIFQFIITLLFFVFLYNPIDYIKINNENPNENLFFYLHVLSYEVQPFYIIEKKINDHYEMCSVCYLCKRYKKCINPNSDFYELDDKANFIIRIENKNRDKLINQFFNILYDGKNKYLFLMKEMILTYKNNQNNLSENNSYFYINLSFLIFAELKNKNYNLALNIKVILDTINHSNKLIEAHETQIIQIIYCNKFLTLVRSTLEQIKTILNSENEKAKKYIQLSKTLKELKNKKYKKVLFNHKYDNISNSKNIIYLCSLLYEEIFNMTLNNNQIPLRENYQLLDRLIYTDKIEKIISLSLNLSNQECKIIRAGRDLYPYKNYNLLDLIPLIFRDYFGKIFISQIIDYFNSNIPKKPKEKKNESIIDLNMEDENTDGTQKNRHLKRGSYKPGNANKNMGKSEYIEFKMIINEEISNRTFYRLLYLNITPLFNNDYNSRYILLDGSFKLYDNTLITLKDIKSHSDTGQKIISVSKPDLEYPPEIYTMSFQKYTFSLEKRNLKLSRFYDFKISNKIISIYSLIPKSKMAYKRLQKVSYSMIDPNLFKPNNLSKFSKKKNDKKKEFILEENSSVRSQKSTYNIANYTTGFNIKTKKKANIYKESKLYKIENVLYLMVPLIILFVIIAIFHLSNLKYGDYTNNYSLVYFEEFYRLYFQLFSTILSVVCINYKSGCVSIMSLYMNDNINLYDFNLTQFFYGQSQVMLNDFIDKKKNLVNIHQNIGQKKYEEIFEQPVNYTRISKIFNKGKIDLSLKNVNMIFAEAILNSINSFQVLTNNTLNEKIYLLNKKENPFLYFDSYGPNSKNLSNFQKELYEMILNYKIFWQQFKYVYYKLLDKLSIQTINIKFFIYLYFNLSYALIILIMVTVYLYIYYFEQLLMHILNYANMVINAKDSNFNFFEEFSKKIKNLNIILDIYKENPIKSINELIMSYNKYEKDLSSKKKNKVYDLSKGRQMKQEKKNMKEIFIAMPNHLKVINKKHINELYITLSYYILFIIIIICAVISYVILFFLWQRYYLIKDNLYALLQKDTKLEISFYKAINIYNLIIFDNNTLDELAQDIHFDEENKINSGIQLINSFYDDLYLVFNYEIEVRVLVRIFASGFPYFHFSCENLYFMVNEDIEKLKLNPVIKGIDNIKEKMFNICEEAGLDFNNDIANAFAVHYQTIMHAINSITDYSYDGLINHLKKGLLGRTFVNLSLIINYITDVINVKLHKVEYDNLLGVLTYYLFTTISFLIVLYIVVVFIIAIFFIWRLKRLCQQIILLKQVFQLREVVEQ